jgi:hypothetical protein
MEDIPGVISPPEIPYLENYYCSFATTSSNYRREEDVIEYK